MSNYWIPCTTTSGEKVCANMEESDGYRNCHDCFKDGVPQYGYNRSCSYVNKSCQSPSGKDCYINQSNCTSVENYNNYGQKIGPHTYAHLDQTWSVQKPYTLG